MRDRRFQYSDLQPQRLPEWSVHVPLSGEESICALPRCASDMAGKARKDARKCVIVDARCDDLTWALTSAKAGINESLAIYMLFRSKYPNVRTSGPLHCSAVLDTYLLAIARSVASSDV